MNSLMLSIVPSRLKQHYPKSMPMTPSVTRVGPCQVPPWTPPQGHTRITDCTEEIADWACELSEWCSLAMLESTRLLCHGSDENSLRMDHDNTATADDLPTLSHAKWAGFFDAGLLVDALISTM